MKWRAVPQLFVEAASEWSADNAPRLGAALAYYAIFSLAPLLILVVAVAGAMFGSEAINGEVEQHLRYVVGPESARYIQTIVVQASEPKSGVLATMISAVVLIFAAMGLFGELRGAMNTVWNIESKPVHGVIAAFLRERFLSFCMLLGCILLLLAALLATTVLTAVTQHLDRSYTAFSTQLITRIISWILVTFLFVLVYRLVPDAIVAWRDVWLGAIVTSLLFDLGNWLIGIYLGKVSVGSVYGAAGSLAVLLVWLYYSAQVFLYGAELTKTFAKRYGAGLLPAPGAVAMD